MRFFDYIRLSLRNLWRSKLRTALTIFAIVIGATSVTIMLALATGAKDFFYKQFEASGQLQQVVVSQQTDLNFDEAQYDHNACSECTKLTDDLAAKIQKIPHVEAVARTTQVFVFESVEYAGKKLRVNNLQSEDANGVIKHTLLAGQGFGADDGAGKIIVGKAYADKMGFKGNYAGLIGKSVDLGTRGFFTGEGATLEDPLIQWQKCSNGGCDNSDGDRNKQPPGIKIKATITGVYGDEDQGETIYFPLKWARGLLQNRRYEMTKADQDAFNAANNTWNRTGRRGPQPVPHFTLITDDQLAMNGYANFFVKVDQSSNTEQVATEVRKLKVGAVTAQSFIEEQLKIFKIMSLVLGGIGGIALVVAAIGVINTMVMATLERTREIGVMRAVGARRSTVSRLFTFEAALLGFLGGVFGVGVGFALTRAANAVINKQLSSNSVQAKNIIGLPVWLILAVIGATTLIGMLAGLYPAHRAAKMNPVDALRYE
jgi:ABC-type antimicrobial peptide transport system permease subunit